MIYTVQILFQNKKHKMYTVDKNKITLDRPNSKTSIQTNGIMTLAREYSP